MTAARRISGVAGCLMGVGACVGPAAAPPSAGAARALSVTSSAAPFTFADGAAAKRQADAACGRWGVRTTIHDRFDAAAGAWVFPGGCA